MVLLDLFQIYPKQGRSKKITVLLRPQVAQMGTAGEERQAKEWEEERERERKDGPL